MSEMKSETWYAKNTGCGGQALIISELDGRNVAVVYEEKDAPLLTAAPELLCAAKLGQTLIELIERWANAERDEADELMSEIVDAAEFETDISKAIAKAEGR